MKEEILTMIMKQGLTLEKLLRDLKSSSTTPLHGECVKYFHHCKKMFEFISKKGFNFFL